MSWMVGDLYVEVTSPDLPDPVMTFQGWQELLQQYEHARQDYDRNLYARVTITGEAIAETRNRQGAFVEALHQEFTGLQRQLQMEQERVMREDGRRNRPVRDRRRAWW